MPYEISTFTLPCGERAARVKITGIFEGREARAMVENWLPGRPMYGLSAMVLSQEAQVAAADARAIISTWKEASPTERWAMVVTDPVARVAGNFILRVAKSTRRQMFSTEAGALSWLDEHARENAAK
jgi:hypothetical protein